jgi:hypothetical protein
MHIYTSGSAMENDPKQNLADNFEHRPNEPATRNDVRALSTLVDSRFAEVNLKFERIDMRFAKVDLQFERIDTRFDKVDVQFQLMRTMFKEELLEFKESLRKDMSDFRESMRKDMFKFAGFLTVSVLSAISIFGTFVR